MTALALHPHLRGFPCPDCVPIATLVAAGDRRDALVHAALAVYDAFAAGDEAWQATIAQPSTTMQRFLDACHDVDSAAISAPATPPWP